MSTPRIVIVTAGLSQPSSTRILADRLAAATGQALSGRGIRVEVEVVELREWARDLANNLLTGFPSAPLGALLDRVAMADGLIAVSPIFSASYSGLFKMFFDVLDSTALQGMPTLIAATGGSARHSLALEHALRPLFSYLRASVAPTAVFAATEDWASEGDLAKRVDRAADELADLVQSRVAARPSRSTPIQSGGTVVPFERLLADTSVATG